MNNLIKLTLTLSILLTGCAAPATAPSFNIAKATENRENQSIFYIYREYAEPTAWKPTIYIDSKEIVSLPQESFSWVYLSPGEHKITSKWSFLAGPPDVEFSVKIEPDKKYYYEITGSSKVTGIAPVPIGILIFSKTTALVSDHEEEKAIPQLEKCCRFIPPKLDGL
ncbi:MAG: DUF2846 domain-containing protein [Thiotrichaceae bacterium]|nr:DUF2846 domain-containing protein [Thiotrichaceae bacterium]PCI10904.1 MAG: hypothetical protein COB71_12410 [Thiotrichales bacterium]PCI13374.1 MAG: hypothetical protein COB71_06305 [Thiotrichales bacterium]